MVKGDTKAYYEGGEEFLWSYNDINLYSMRFCPFAHRVRLMLAAKNLPHNVINIDLKNKPEWFLEINPKGAVPTLQEPVGKVLTDSLIISEYLDDVHKPLYQFLPYDHLQRAQQKILVEIITQKFINKINAFKQGPAPDALQGVLDGLNEVEGLLKGDYFHGRQVQWVDLMVWPWFQRIPSFEEVYGFSIPWDQYPKTKAWIERMESKPFTQQCDQPVEIQTRFMKGQNSGKPNFDEGLDDDTDTESMASVESLSQESFEDFERKKQNERLHLCPSCGKVRRPRSKINLKPKKVQSTRILSRKVSRTQVKKPGQPKSGRSQKSRRLAQRRRRIGDQSSRLF